MIEYCAMFRKVVYIGWIYLINAITLQQPKKLSLQGFTPISMSCPRIRTP